MMSPPFGQGSIHIHLDKSGKKYANHPDGSKCLISVITQAKHLDNCIHFHFLARCFEIIEARLK